MTRERRLRALEERMPPWSASAPGPMRDVHPIIADDTVVAIINRASGEEWHRSADETVVDLLVRARLTFGEACGVLNEFADETTTNRPPVDMEVEQ